LLRAQPAARERVPHGLQPVAERKAVVAHLDVAEAAALQQLDEPARS
jgi:hypothetical protein